MQASSQSTLVAAYKHKMTPDEWWEHQKEIAEHQRGIYCLQAYRNESGALVKCRRFKGHEGYHGPAPVASIDDVPGEHS